MDDESTARMLTADQRMKWDAMRDQLLAIMDADKARRKNGG